MPTRKQLRNELKQRRNTHSKAQCQELSLQICEHIRRSKPFTHRQRLALYYSIGNEVSLEHLFHYAWTLNKTLFLPVLSHFPKGHLWWIKFLEHTPLYLNRYQIPEPVHPARARRTKLRSLDVIFMPLVGFDDKGNRLGMGGGYYDRSLSRCFRPSTAWHRPVRVGVAYSWQQVTSIPVETWDIPLDAIVTEQGVHWFNTK